MPPRLCSPPPRSALTRSKDAWITRGGVGGGSTDCEASSATSSAAAVLRPMAAAEERARSRDGTAAPRSSAVGDPAARGASRTSGSGGSASEEMDRSRRAAGASAADGVNDDTVLLVTVPRARAEAPSCSPMGLKRTSDRRSGGTVTRSEARLCTRGGVGAGWGTWGGVCVWKWRVGGG